MILAAVLCTSCDLLCKMAGRPTKGEVAAKRVEIAFQKAAAQAAAQAAADSVAAAALDSALTATAAPAPAPVEEEVPVKVSEVAASNAPAVGEDFDYKYYVVVGSFKSEGNAKWQASRVRSAGFAAFVREYRGGDYYNVLAGGCNDYSEAVATRKALLELSFIPKESWILNDKK